MCDSVKNIFKRISVILRKICSNGYPFEYVFLGITHVTTFLAKMASLETVSATGEVSSHFEQLLKEKFQVNFRVV